MQTTDSLPNALIEMQFSDIRDVLNLGIAPIDALMYQDAQQNNVPIQLNQKAFIHILKAYHVFWNEEGDPVGDGWLSIVAEVFDNYRTSPSSNLITMSGSITTATSMEEFQRRGWMKEMLHVLGLSAGVR